MLDLIKKVILLPFIFALLMFIINYFVNKIQSHINLEFFDIIYYLGVAQALQVLVTFAIVGFVANHMFNYFKNL